MKRYLMSLGTLVAMGGFAVLLGCQSANSEFARVDRILADENGIASTPVTFDSAGEKPNTNRSAIVKLLPGQDLMRYIRSDQDRVIIDFYADWCGPCKSQDRHLQDCRDDFFAQRTLVVKVNVDEHPGLAKKFDVMSLPTLFLVKKGKVLDRSKGQMGVAALRQWNTR